jgi:hypothetical protein
MLLYATELKLNSVDYFIYFKKCFNNGFGGYACMAKREKGQSCAVKLRRIELYLGMLLLNICGKSLTCAKITCAELTRAEMIRAEIIPNDEKEAGH